MDQPQSQYSDLQSLLVLQQALWSTSRQSEMIIQIIKQRNVCLEISL